MTNVDEAPVISSNGGEATAAISINENESGVSTVKVYEIDAGKTLTYTITGGADAALLDINATTGALSFKTAPNFEAPTDAGSNNIYDVVVQVSDGKLTDTQAVAVSVTDINEAPVITSNGGRDSAGISFFRIVTAITKVQAADADLGNTLSYSISGGDDEALFKIDAATGALSFKTTPRFEAPADAGRNNVYDVVVQVSDGSLTDTQAIAVIVTNEGGRSARGYSLTGTDGNDTVVGSTWDDILRGGGGNDKLFGGSGNDMLTGGAGADWFVFDTAANATRNVDQITDFVSGTDKLQFSKAVFAGLSSAALGDLSPDAFWSGAGVSTAHDATDRFIYNTTSGALYYDADGTGSGSTAVQVALLGSVIHPAINFADIQIIG